MTSAADWDEELAEEEPLHRKRDRGEDVEMDITPMIDITFLLLIFFVVCSIPDQDTAVELPQAKYGKGVSQKNSVIITLSDEGADAAPIYLADGKDGDMLPADVDLQKEMIQEAVEKGRHEEQKDNVLIKADRNVAYRDVEKVIQAVSRVAAQKFILASPNRTKQNNENLLHMSRKTHSAGSTGDFQKGSLGSNPDDDMDLTPMVDVTFLLLIFFMITAAFALQKSLEVPPVAEDEAAPAQTVEDLELDSVVIRIDADNVFWIGAPKWDEEQKAPSVQDMLIKLREARDSITQGSPKLLVQASGDSRHEFVVAALDAGSGVGMEEIRLMRYDDDAMDF